MALEHEELSNPIVGAAIEVHRTLGPGLFESAYRRCMVYELQQRGLRVETEVTFPLSYKGIEIDQGYRLDLLVERSVVVELKAVERLDKIFEAQLLTYMKLAGVRVGLLINFHSAPLCDGIVRRVL